MTIALAAVLLAPLAATPAGAVQQNIGNVEMVRVWAYGTPTEQVKRDLLVETKVFDNELVETVRDGALHMRFLDNTVLRLGSNSRVELDSFVYDKDNGTGEMALTLVEGLFRFITGDMNDESITIRTPTATIAVRGTDIIILITPEGTFMSALFGEGQIKSLADGSVIVVTPGGPGAVVPPGGSASPFFGSFGQGDTGIGPCGDCFEGNTEPGTKNTGKGGGGSASAGQTPAGTTPAALFGGEGGGVLTVVFTNDVLNGGGTSFGGTTTDGTLTDSCTDCTTVVADLETVEAEKVEALMTFDSGICCPLDYSEEALTSEEIMTVTSIYPSGGHLHLLGGELGNHLGCCSTPYIFALVSGELFDLISFEQISGGIGDIWTSSTGEIYTVTELGLQILPEDGFTDIESVTWDTSGNSVIDDLVYATTVPGS